MSDDSYRRQIDLWIKIMVVVSPLLSAAMAWGIAQGQLASVKDSVSKIEGWISAHQEFTISSVKESGQMLQQLKQLNENMAEVRMVINRKFGG